MKVTRKHLRRLINEELTKIVLEQEKSTGPKAKVIQGPIQIGDDPGYGSEDPEWWDVPAEDGGPTEDEIAAYNVWLAAQETKGRPAVAQP